MSRGINPLQGSLLANKNVWAEQYIEENKISVMLIRDQMVKMVGLGTNSPKLNPWEGLW